MRANFCIIRIVISTVALCLLSVAEAGKPVWTLSPLTATTLSVPSNDTATVQYQVTNQSLKTHVLSMQPIQGISQVTTGSGVCGNPFVLAGNASCTLSLQINGSQLTDPISDGPIVCEQGSALQCYRPATGDILHITQDSPINTATITVTGSPLTLTTAGPTGTLTIINSSLIVPATNITSNFANTSLNGNVTETGNTCASIQPLSSCILTYTPGSTVVAQTDFPIQGSNTNSVTAAIQIDAGITLTSVSPSSGPSSGGTGVTLTGIGLNGVTGVTFNGVAATGVNAVDSTTVTAVTPRYTTATPQAVNVVISTSGGDAAKANGYTYLTTAIGQPAYGGVIACLNDGNYLIAPPFDNASSSGGYIEWAPSYTSITTDNTNGASNTNNIVNIFNPGISYAAGLCDGYQVDSLGNSPCQNGNACYDDWFLPAGNNTTNLGQLNCLYVNRIAIGNFNSGNAYYWSSTQSGTLTSEAYIQNFNGTGTGGQETTQGKLSTQHLRCVRSFTP